MILIEQGWLQMRTITFCLLVGIIFSCSENRAHSEDMLEGKIYFYKEEHGATREIEVYFPKSHEATHDSVPGIIMFHGGGWGGLLLRPGLSWQNDGQWRSL